MLTQLEIYNHACSAVGTRGSITSLAEASRERTLCDTFYPTVRKQVLCAHHWAAGLRGSRLTQIVERDFAVDWDVDDHPLPPWAYSYEYPDDMLHPRYLTNYENFTLATQAMGNDPRVPAILTNRGGDTVAEKPILIYTADEDDTTLWSTGLASAVYMGLAAHICKPLTGSTRKQQGLLEEANRHIMIARIADANSEMVPQEHMPDWLVARGISGPTNPNRFIYPVGSLFTGVSE